STEELQSVNEELTSVNSQLQDKIETLTSANDDLNNLLTSTDIATVFVDTNLVIKRFTQMAAQVFCLLPSDRGRPLGHLALNMVGVNLADEAHAVLRDLVPVEKEVTSRDGKQYIARLVPYRTTDRFIRGVVLTMVNITLLKKAQEELARVNDELERRVIDRTKWLALMHDVTRGINEAQTWDEALHRVLRHTCESEGWQIGYVYLPDANDPDTIVPAIGYLENDRFHAFDAVASAARYKRGDRLPGHVYANGMPVWIFNHDDLVRSLPVRGAPAMQ